MAPVSLGSESLLRFNLSLPARSTKVTYLELPHDSMATRAKHENEKSLYSVCARPSF